jgi:glycosyltransferase involved in cell wall biosynthesis
MELKKNNKIVLIHNIPNPYRIPLFNELNKILKSENYKLKVIFGTDTYKRRKWKIDLKDCFFPFKILRSNKIHFGNTEKTIITYRGLFFSLMKERPGLLILTGYSLASIKVYFYSLIFGIPFVVWNGSIDNIGRYESKLKLFYRRFITKRAKGFVAYGTKAKEYLQKIGAKEDKIVISYNTVDLDYYYSNDINEKQRRILFVGYLTKGKRVDLLFNAIKVLQKRREDFEVVIVGDGPEKQNLIQIVQDFKMNDIVNFVGFKQKEEIIKYYKEALFFVFPSQYDIWGLVINEAMAAGLPCVSSCHAGASKDLIKNGETGFVVDFEDSYEVVERFDYLLDNDNAVRMGMKSQEFIMQNITINASAKRFLEVIKKVS